MNGQCDLIVYGEDITNCDDNGTPLDPSDDTYEVTVRVYNDDTEEFFDNDFGPFDTGTGTNPIVLLEDPNNTSCTMYHEIEEPESCIAPNCPNFTITLSEILETDGCGSYVLVSFSGFTSSDYVRLIDFDINMIGGGTITGVNYVNTPNPLEQAGVTLSTDGSMANIYYFDINEPISGDDISSSNVIRIDLMGEPGECLQLQVSNNSRVMVVTNPYNGLPVQCTAQGDFDATDEYCVPSITVSGKVTGFSEAWTPCEGTQSLNIINAEVSITGENGSCLDNTDNNGDYSCDLCPSDEYEICVETTCPEPCGLTDLDVVLLRDYIVGNRTVPGPEFFFTSDVDRSGDVSTYDVHCMQEYLLYGTTSCTDNWCRFVPVEEFSQLSGTTFQISSPVDNCITFTDDEIINQLVSTDFIRFNVGDLNGSCDDCVHGEGGPYFIEGETPVALQKNDVGWQIALTQDYDLLAYTSTIELGSGITSEMVEINTPLPGISFNVEEGILHMIWVEKNDTKDLFNAKANKPFITFTINTDREVSTKLISDDNYILDIEEGIFKLTEGNTEAELRKQYESEQSLRLNNYEKQYIPVVSEQVNVQMFDMSGRKILDSDFQLHDGMNQLQMETTALNTGIYIVRYVADQCIFSQKIFVE